MSQETRTRGEFSDRIRQMRENVIRAAGLLTVEWHSDFPRDIPPDPGEHEDQLDFLAVVGAANDPSELTEFEPRERTGDQE